MLVLLDGGSALFLHFRYRTLIMLSQGSEMAFIELLV